MDTPLTIAVLGASISAVGWIVNYILSASAERRRQSLTTQIAFTKQQLEELYGTLMFLIMEGRNSAVESTRALKKSPDVNKIDVWKYWIENEFFPRNEKIKYLLASKAHLIEDQHMPPSWIKFIEHHNSWKVQYDLWQRNLDDFPASSRTPWPIEFSRDIESTFTMLKQRQAYLMGLVVCSISNLT